jgi:hypothetical protein
MSNEMHQTTLEQKGAALKETITQKKQDREELGALKTQAESYARRAQEGGFWDTVAGFFGESGTEEAARHLRETGTQLEATEGAMTVKGEQIEKLGAEIKDAHETYADSRQVYDDLRSEIASTQLTTISL